MAHKQSLSDLQGAFHGLSENHHKIIVMRELEGLSYSQIGERLGMSRPMVESTLFRARKRLSEEYDELVSGRRCEHVQLLIAGEERRSLLKLGVRERRQLARHLAHCQPCRREARMAGVDESFFKAPKTLAGKIAALLPFPWLRWRRSNGGSEDAATSHSWNAVQGAQTVARLSIRPDPRPGSGAPRQPRRRSRWPASAPVWSRARSGVMGIRRGRPRPRGSVRATPAAAHIASSSAGGSRSRTGHSQQTGGSGGGSSANGSGGGSGASVGSGSGSSAPKPSSGAGSGSASSPSAQSGGGGAAEAGAAPAGRPRTEAPPTAG